jgi:hypothetical protein
MFLLGQMFPNHIGIPAGDNSDDATYFKLEVHYHNPMRKSCEYRLFFGNPIWKLRMILGIILVIDNSGLRIFYTEKLRENDAGTMFLGHRVTPFQMIPQFQDEFRTHSFCSKECTENVTKFINYPGHNSKNYSKHFRVLPHQKE